jgi:hypothetical protein
MAPAAMNATKVAGTRHNARPPRCAANKPTATIAKT